jgi:hypothetical protein
LNSDCVNKAIGWQDSPFIAVVTWNGIVKLFDASSQRFVAEFSIHKNSGGVNVAISSNNKQCFCGTYYAWGLACFDIGTGRVVWHRKDLKRFYGLSFSPARNSLFAYFDGKGALELDPNSGATRNEFRGVVEIHASRCDESLLLAERKKIVFVGKDGKKLWSVPRESFAILDVAWSQDTVAISEVGADNPDGSKAGIRCFSLHGELLWRYKGQNTHVDPLQFRQRTNSFIGVDFTSGEACLLVELDKDSGKVSRQKIVPSLPHWGFCQSTEQYFTVNHTSYEVALEKF